MPDASPAALAGAATATSSPPAPVAPAAAPAVVAADARPKTKSQVLSEKLQEHKAKLKAEADAKAAGIDPNAPKPAPEAAAKEQERRAQAMARIKREEAKVLRERETLKTERETWTRENAATVEKAKMLDHLQTAYQKSPAEFAKAVNLPALAKADPLKFLEMAGLTFEDIAKLTLKGDTRTPEEVSRSTAQDEWRKLQAAKDELDRRTKAENEDLQLSNNVKEAQKTLQGLIDANPEKYEFLSQSPGAASEVWKHMVEDYRVTGKVPDYAETLDLAEQVLEEQNLSQFKTSKKIQAALQKEQDAKAAEAKKQADAAQAQNRGRRSAPKPPEVSSSSAPTTPTPSPVPPRRETIAERVARLKEQAQAQRARQQN